MKPKQGGNLFVFLGGYFVQSNRPIRANRFDNRIAFIPLLIGYCPFKVPWPTHFFRPLDLDDSLRSKLKSIAGGVGFDRFTREVYMDFAGA